MAVSQNILCLNIVLQRNEKLDILDSTVKTEYTRNILYSTLSFVLLLLTSRSTFLMNIFIELWVLIGPFYLLNRAIIDKLENIPIEQLRLKLAFESWNTDKCRS